MICSECPLAFDGVKSNRILLTIAVTPELYEWLIFHSDRLHELGYTDHGYRPTPASIVLHAVAKYANRKLFDSPLNVSRTAVHDFDSLQLFKKDVH